MTTTEPGAASVPLAPTRRSNGLAAYTRHYLRRRPLAAVAFGVVGLAFLLAIFAPLIVPYDPEVPTPADALLAPSPSHLFGTDASGFDVFSRVLASMRMDLGIAVTGTLLAFALGAPLGVLAGYHAGRRSIASVAGETTMRLADVIQSFPVFILALALVAMSGPSARNVIIAVAFVNFPMFLRLFRAETLSLRERAYIDASRVAGVRSWRVLRTHVVPNAMGSALVQVSVSVGMAILLTAGVSFIGAGVRQPTPELGSMVSIGATDIVTGQWWPSVFPGIAMGIVVLAFAVVGDAIGELSDPRKRT